MNLNENKIPYDLEILSLAEEYQKWSLDAVKPFLGNRILEIGAGIGNMSRWLPVKELLVITEADPFLVKRLRQVVSSSHGENASVRVEEIDLRSDWSKSLKNESIDTVVSFNVLEHVEDEIGALKTFADLLRASKSTKKKRIVTFVPAHKWAMGSIDKGYGHFRRYERSDFEKLRNEAAPDFDLKTRHFNVFGLPGWLLMSFISNKKGLDKTSILAFEKVCPLVRNIDDFLHTKFKLPFGQSIISIMTLRE